MQAFFNHEKGGTLGVYCTVLTVEREEDKQRKTQGQGRRDMRISPGVRAARPVQTQQHEGGAGDEQDGPDGVAGPDALPQRHGGMLGCVLLRRRPVETEDPGCGEGVEDRLHPEDVPPPSGTGVRDGAGAEGRDPRWWYFG